MLKKSVQYSAFELAYCIQELQLCKQHAMKLTYYLHMLCNGLSQILTDIWNHAGIQCCDHGLHWMFGFIQNRLYHGILSYTLHLIRQISMLQLQSKQTTLFKSCLAFFLPHLPFLTTSVSHSSVCNATGEDYHCTTLRVQHALDIISTISTISSALMHFSDDLKRNIFNSSDGQHTWSSPVLGQEALSI